MIETPSQEVGRAPEVLMPDSAQGAIAAFGDGADVTVFGGGTVLMPPITRSLLRPRRALFLKSAGLDRVESNGERVTLGAMLTLAALTTVAPEPVASAACIPDYEIRGQATLGGNLFVQGDLQAPLLVLDGQVLSAGAGGQRREPVADFLSATEPRLVLGVDVRRPRAAAYVEQRRPHAHTFTVLSVAVAEFDDGIRVAVGGAEPRAVRATSVERALAAGGASAAAAEAITQDVTTHDDELASAWYRQRVLPVLVARALDKLTETR